MVSLDFQDQVDLVDILVNQVTLDIAEIQGIQEYLVILVHQDIVDIVVSQVHLDFQGFQIPRHFLLLLSPG